MAQSLLQQVADGRMEAMQRCLDEYGGLVWSLARRSCSAAEAEDAVQEIFIAIWESAARYQPALGSEVTFVATIARRRLIDRVRKRGREPKRQAETTMESLEKVQTLTAKDWPTENDEVQTAVRAIEQLTADQQLAIKLSVFYGYSHELIAEHTGMPLGTVKTHIRRGLIRVRELLQEVTPDRTVGYSS